MALLGNCSLRLAPKDDGKLSPIPRDDGTPSVVPVLTDVEVLDVVPGPAANDDDVVVKVEDTGIEKFSVGCLFCELLVLAVDRAFGTGKLNICEVLIVLVPTNEGNVGLVKFLLLTVEDTSDSFPVRFAVVIAGTVIVGL